MKPQKKSLLLLVCLLFTGYALAEDQQTCDRSGHCVLPGQQGVLITYSDSQVVRELPVNSEKQQGGIGHASGNCAAQQEAPLTPFQISVDGVPLGQRNPVDAAGEQRCTDLVAARASVQIRYDNMEQTPWLNIHATPNAAGFDEQVQFVSYSNYPAWIERAEVRLFKQGRSVRQKPLEIFPIDVIGKAQWQQGPGLGDELIYVLRVYDDKGRFDETEPKRLQLSRTNKEQSEEDGLLAGYGENSRRIANIPVSGGAVTVNGSQVQPGEQVWVMGFPIPVDPDGLFATRQILPPGPHEVMVSIGDGQDVRAEFTRYLDIALDDWFYLGLADLTIGQNDTNGPAQLVTADESDQYADEVYVNGRLAFYLKGKIKGKYLLTAAADTREQPIENLFTNFAEKDPRYLLRRLDPEQYYPVYGDDSTTVEDAPTQGRFYVRLERGDSEILWGNFHTSITGTEFANYNRGLYGARIRFVSPEMTQYGERRGEIEAFGADPGSLGARDEFLATGGSLYYLQRQDLTQGSERIWVEVRDKNTGLVLETKYLTPIEDYDVNYLQGRIMLQEPLSSIRNDGFLVSTGSLSGHPVYLVVSYEYTPGLSEADDLVRGGRLQVWANDHLQLGLSGYKQDAPGMEQKITEADITLRYRPGTYVKLEKARSDGPGNGMNASVDGGFNFQGTTSLGGEADAELIEAAVDLSEVTADQQGRATAYRQHREAGFSAPGQITGSDAVTQQGTALSWQTNERLVWNAKLDEYDRETDRTLAAEIDVRYQLDKQWEMGLGIGADDREMAATTSDKSLEQEGQRTDSVIRLDYQPEAGKDEVDWSAYGYLQGTLSRDASRVPNNRVGFGGQRRLSRRFELGGELSTGDGGLGALAQGDYQVDDQSSLYLGYQLTTDRTDTGYRGRQGTLAAGARTRFNDSASVYGEERYQHGDGPSGLTHAFGLELAPSDRWQYGFNLEVGDIRDPDAGELKRRVAGFSLGYVENDTKYAGNLEFRRDDGSNGRRETWLMRNTLGYQVDSDWRFIGRLNLSYSEASDGNFYDGEFVEGSFGYAYRPVENDRLNALVKYTYLYDLPAANQLTGTGDMTDYAQRSHVVAMDALYDLFPWCSLGGKYAYRLGELRDNRTTGPWLDSEAWLGIIRADLHWVYEWDLLIEGRQLEVVAADDRRSGMLAAVYRHLGQNMKVGVGYNFTDFSDDLTDLSYDSRGWFINIVGKI